MLKNELFVSEIFKSVQGEGEYVGKPSIFLRLGICNLHCKWEGGVQCDAFYTWKPGFTDYKQMSPNEIITEIQRLRKGTQIRNLVITGGEPMLQQAKIISQLFTASELENMDIEIETNGSIRMLPDTRTESLVRRVRFNISPKLADSGNNAYNVNFYPNAILKFVYASKKTELLIDEFLEKYKEETKDIPVYIMPEGVKPSEMRRNYKNILKYCYKRGFKFCPRLHIYLFGNKRAT